MVKLKFKRLCSEEEKKNEKTIKAIYRLLKDNKSMSYIFSSTGFDRDELLSLMETCAKDLIKTDMAHKRLNFVRKILYIAKSSVSEDITLMYDDTYDRLLNIYKDFREEEIVEKFHGSLANKRTVDVEHKYPELKGTIDKVHCFYKKDENKTKSLERVLDKWFGCLFPGEHLMIKITLKFDGVSIIITIKNGKVIQALTRGEDGKGADLTDLFINQTFKKYSGGLKCECVITDDYIDELNKIRKKKYVSRRSAVVGALSGSDAYKSAHCLTLIPLQLTDNNKYKIKDLCDERYVNKEYFMQSNKIYDLIEMIKEFVEKVIEDRDKLPFDIDGIVIDALNPSVINKMGRKDSINRYQIAYKFPPQVRYTKVTYIDFTVGRTGLIIPMVHYEPIYFNGGRHTKSTLSSFKRFKELKLHEGEEIKVTYNNDVMPYVSNTDRPQSEVGDLIEFPKVCICGTEFEVDGANLRCTNKMCIGSKPNAFYHFYRVMGVENFAEKSVEKLLDLGLIENYEDLLNISYEMLINNVEGYKEKKTKKVINQIEEIKKSDIEASKLLHAMGTCGISTANTIMDQMSLEDLANTPENIFNYDMELMGELSKQNFLDKFVPKKDFFIYMINNFNVVNTKKKSFKASVCFTGFRDAELVSLLETLGIEVVDFKKTVDALIVKDKATMSESKKKKADKWGIPIYSREEYIQSLRDDL